MTVDRTAEATRTRLDSLRHVLTDAEQFDLELLGAVFEMDREVKAVLQEVRDAALVRLPELRDAGISLDTVAETIRVGRMTLWRHAQDLGVSNTDRTRAHVLRAHERLVTGLRAWLKAEAKAAKRAGRDPWEMPATHDTVMLDGEEYSVGQALYAQKRAARFGKIDGALESQLTELLGPDWSRPLRFQARPERAVR